MVFNLVLNRRIKSTYLKSKQGEPIPDSIRTKCSSFFAVLIQNKVKCQFLVASVPVSESGDGTKIKEGGIRG